jgi:hypothetical protein
MRRPGAPPHAYISPLSVEHARDPMICSSQPSAAALSFDIGDDVGDTALAAVIWHVPLRAEEFGGLLLPF